MSAAPVPATSGALTAPPPVQQRTEVPAARFAIGDDDFLLDGAPFRILSGALHYFRVHPQQWADRIAKARQMGLNTIETYVAWNAHAPTEEAFDLTGGLDLGHFLDLVADAGMYAIVRPGPYICAEWTNGGLPAWLFRTGTAGVRRNEPTFMAAVGIYFQQLAPVITPRQISHGGPIILVQVENEYGAYGADHSYLRKLVSIYHESGIDVPLTTVDQPVADMLANGSLPELHKTGSFGSRIPERLDTLRRHQPTGPLMCAEFWNGWFDEWGGHHHQTTDADAAHSLDELLSRGASVNIYMFHGGTNFGFTNGANDKGTYRPIITSYDYDAPLDEAGNPTAKYWAYRDILRRYATIPDEAPTSADPAPTLHASFRQQLPLWQLTGRLGTWTRHDNPPTADEIGHYVGFTLYRTAVAVEQPCVLHIDDVRDRAQIFLNRHSLGVLARDHGDRSLTLPGTGDLDVLVEDLGRVDYGPKLGEPKGLVGTVTADGQPLCGWQVLPLKLDDITAVTDALRPLPTGPVQALAGPVFARATFDLPAVQDLYLDTGTWGKGVVWINGFCLGRYWSRGPQRTLYIPAPTLREAGNELIVLELHATPHADVRFVPSHDLGPSES
jgi:beta-galactosidase